MKKMNYESDIGIDGESLDLEWLRQPQLMMKYSRHSAQSQKDLESAKQNLDIAKAEADTKIRACPDVYGIEKVTEAVVANAILKESGYIEASENYLNMKFEADMARAAVNAFEHKKTALENLVKLYGQQYFSGPKVPYEINREWVSHQKSERISKRISEGMIRRRKEREEEEDD